MFGEHPLDDAVRAARAIATNQIARFLPRQYIEMTGETGRGRAHVTPRELADYHLRCFDDYLVQLALDRTRAPDALGGRSVIEYGPGDVPGTAFLLVAYGAESVTCVDRFPLLRHGLAADVLRYLLDGLPPAQRARALGCFRTAGDPNSGLSEARIRYVLRPNGLSGEHGTASIVLSRAVLEHVNDLPATFRDMRSALAPGGIAIHLVDLKSHGLHRRNPLDFLTWPQWLWTTMYSCKGVPNRLRPGAYRAAATAAGLEVTAMTPTGFASESDINEVRPRLAQPFRSLSDEELSWLGFWLVAHVPQVH